MVMLILSRINTVEFRCGFLKAKEASLTVLFGSYFAVIQGRFVALGIRRSSFLGW